MNLYYFISKRISTGNKQDFSYLVSKIAVISIAVGIAILIIAFAILEGFQKNIKEKIFSFGAHLQVTKYDAGRSQEEAPLSIFTNLYQYPDSVSGVRHIQVFSHKPGLMRTSEDVMGVVVKGVGRDFNLGDFKQNIVEGRFLEFKDTIESRDIMVSRRLSNLMEVSIGDSVIVIFSQPGGQAAKFRKLHICGLFQTGLEEFDEQVVLSDIKLNQDLNDWPDSWVGGYEIFVKDFSKLDDVAENVYEYMDYDMEMEKITDKYIQIFDWLTLLDRNVYIFLILILFVAAFNMVSTILIMIMERTNMIGMLKAMGAANNQIQKIFFYNGMLILGKGLFYGNLIGLSFSFVQYYFKLIPLDADNYYMDTVPVEWNLYMILGLNIMTIAIISIVLFLPAMIIARVKPINAIKFN